MTDRFPGFATHDVAVPGGAVHLRRGGDGPPVLLLHGYPESHLMWHGVAPALAAAGHEVVVPDLPGYGASTPPPVTADHAPHAKRATAATLVAVMAELGHERFAVLGHDRGGRVAYRMALDAPDAVERLAVLDIVPTLDVWERAGDRFAVGYWHWGFLAQPAPLPERLALGDPDAFWEHHVRRMGIDPDSDRFPADVTAAYRAALREPARVEAMCEDYRAGLGPDREHDAADRDRGATVEVPTLVLWGARGALPLLYDDVLAIWRAWAPGTQGRALEAGHFLVEERPDETARLLTAFLAGEDLPAA